MFRYFQIDFKKLLLILFVFALPLVSLQLQRGPEEPPWYTEPFSVVAGLLVNGYTNFSQGVRGTVSMYLNLIDVKKDNRLLLRENAELRAKLSELNELKAENSRLNKLLDFQSRAPMKLLAARVTAIDLLGEHATIRINRGSSHGLAKGLAVITFEGVVGYILNVELHSSSVLVLTDRYAVIDSLVQRTRARGIVEGESVDTCKLKYLHRADDVVEGDLVVTSGLDDIFPKGFPVATVIAVEKKNYGVTQKVSLRPVVDPSRLEEVFVVLKVLPQPELEAPVTSAKPTTTPVKKVGS